MKKHFTNLRMALVGFLVCLMSMSMMAQTPAVTLDFTTNDWNLPASSADGGTTAQSFTNTDGYTVTLYASTKFYYYYNTYTDDNYHCLMLGKNNSTLTLPAFDFDVEKIEIVGTSNASAAVKLNFFVGDVAVSTQTTGIKDTTQTFMIAPEYQAAGNIYMLKVQSNHNSQIAYVKVYAAETTPDEPVVIEPTWVSCDQVGIFNTQVTGLVPTCSTVGDSTVYHFAYTSDFTGFPEQTPSTEMGGQLDRVYVDVKIMRPNTDITGVKVSYGPDHEEIIDFTDVEDPFNGTLGAPHYAILHYFPVATVNTDGSVTGNAIDRNWTIDIEWCTGTEVVAIQKLNVLVDAAPAAQMPDLDVDSIATLPYTYNFDEGNDPYFVINNGEATNAWYIGQAQTFDNNKLYISSNGGTTNKYDITAASTVTAYRDLMIPEAGAILTFDYRVNGQTNTTDYLKVELNGTEIARLVGENEWAAFNYDIPGTMAGEVRLQFTWVNNATNGNQFPAAIDNISVIVTPCSQPAALTATMDSTTAVITWVAAEGQTAWNFQYKLVDHSEWYTVSATDTTVTLTDLQGNSNYEMRVQAVCGEFTSAWTNGTFAVACQSEEIGTAPGDVVIGTGTSTTYMVPFNSLYGYSFTEQIYPASEVGTEGNIYSVSFYLGTSNAAEQTNSIDLYMKNVTRSTFSSTTDYEPVAAGDIVYSGSWTIPANYTGWVTINLDNPFMFDGTSNLMIAMHEKTSGYSTRYFTYTSATNSGISYYSDSSNPDPFNLGSYSGSKALRSNLGNLQLNRDITTVVCADAISCADPSNLEVSDITPNSAVLTWTAGAEDQTAFIVEYQAEGATEWTSVDVNDTTYTLTELPQLTNYSVKVKANCGTNNWSDVITGSFRTIGICPPVTNLETANVSNTTTLTWTAGGEENAWLVQFKPASAGEDAWTSIDVSLIPMTTFGGLVGNTDYEVRVKALCDPENEENQSDWASTTFHSGCAAFEVPFTEEFPTNTMPTCWENQDFHFASSGYAYSYTNGAELISPAVNIPAENTTYLSFEVRGAGDYTVLASYRGTRADRFAEIYTGTAPNQNAIVIVPLDDLYKGRAVNFKIVNNSTSYQYFYYVAVNQCPFKVTSLTTSNVAGTTLDLAWQAPEEATNFQIQYGEQGFTVGEGTSVEISDTNATTISNLNYETSYDFYIRTVCASENTAWFGPVNTTTAPACSQPSNLQVEALTASSYYVSWSASTWTVDDNTQYVVGYKAEGESEYTETEPTTALFTTISDLLSNTTYTVAVRAICSEDYSSAWGNTVTFTTPCALLSLPYTEDFESYSATTSYSTLNGGVMADCWTSDWTATPSSSSNYGPKVTNTTSYNPNGSGKFLFFLASSYTYTYYQNPTTVILPAFDVDLTTAMISFKVRGSNTSNVNLNLGYVNDNNEFTALTPVTFGTTAGAASQTVVLNNYTIPTGVKLAFQANVTGTSTATKYFGLDDITVELIPNCFVPSVEVSGATATITRNVNGNEPQSYDVQIGDAVQNVTTNTVDLYTLFGLDLNTSYQVRVRAICSETDASDWTDWTAFTTPPCIGGASFSKTGTSTTTYLPSNSCYNYAYSQQIFLSSEINAPAGGQISSISLQVSSSPKTRTMEIYMKNVSQSSFASTTDWVSISGATKVFSGSYTFAQGWNEIAFTTPFDYNGTDNLVLIVDDNTGSYSCTMNFNTHSAHSNSSLYIYSDGTNYNPNSSYTGTRLSVRDNIKFDVCPAPTCGTPSISVTGSTATITPSANGTPVSYDLQIGDQTATVTSTTVDLMSEFNLEFNTEYEISVRANCGEGDYSTWSSLVSFTTPACADPCVYTVAMVDEYGDGWNGNEIYVKLNGTLVETLTIESGDSQTTTVMVCDGTVSFEWAEGSYADEASFTIEDGTGTTLYSCADGSTLTDGQVLYSGTCGVVPTCFAPTQLTVSEVGESSAVVTWVDEDNQGLYTLQYKAEVDADWTDVTNIDTISYLLNNLTASTEYSVRVKAVCGTDDESEYTNEVGFRTNCIGAGAIEFTGTNTSTYIPTFGNYNYSFTQQIYLASEIGTAGTISGISFEVTNTGTRARNIDVYLMHTSQSTISSWLPMDNAQLVYSGVVGFTEGWQEIPFNTQFAYNGSDNLVLIVDDNTGEWNNYPTFGTHSASSGSSRYAYNDGTNYDPTNPSAVAAGSAYAYRNNVRFAVCPEAIDIAITGMNSIADACNVEGAVTINVKNCGYEPVSGFTAYYQVNEETPVQEAVTAALALNETTTYTFSQLPSFTADENVITAWVVMEGDAVEANNSITSAPVTVLAPATVPYEEAFTGLTINHGWNPIDANEDGITMNLNNNINYTFNDEAAADDWMMSPCIEMAAGTYTIIYDYKANSSLTEAFEVYYGNGNHVADMTNAVATHSFNNTTYETATNTITIAADGVYNFGFHATSLPGNLGFSIDNFKVYPVNDVIVTSAPNGTVTPNGTIAVNYGENLTLNLVPDPMYHVAGVWVDDVQVVPEDGTGANFMLYTLENVTEPHTVFVDFKLEFHIFKTVENFRADLYSDLGGAFVPAATDTTIDPNAFTVNMVADPHYHLAGLTVSPMVPDMPEDVFAGVVDNGDGTYSYTIDTLVVANYYVNATFRRDTVAINYTALTGKGYANDSPLLNTGDTYTTWVDYSVNHDVDTTVTFTTDAPYYVADVLVNGVAQGRIESYTFENVTETQTVGIKYGYKIDASVSNYNTYGDIAMDDPQGTIEPATQYIPEFDPMTVTGTVAEHFHLYQLLVNGEDRIDEVVFGADPHNYSFTMDSVDNNYTIIAMVKVDTFAITYNVLAGQGYADASELLVAGDTYSTIVNYGDNWYSEIAPATGYSIGNVTLDGENMYTASNNQFNFIVESHVFDINFVANTYTITTNAYGAGTVSDDTTFVFDPENPVNYEFTATPDEGYYVSAVIINNEAQDLTDVEGAYTTTIENVADNYVINAHFSIYTYTMTAEAGEGGTITPDGAQTVNYGTDVTYEINANEGWYIASTVIDGVTTNYTQADEVVTLTVPFTGINDNHEVSVTFAQFMYTITGTVGANGTVNGETTINAELAYGSNYSLNIVPADNYQVADVVVDGESVGAVEFYEFINITENHTVAVTFEAIMYTLTATSNTEGCTITPATTTVQAGTDVAYTLTVANGYHLVNVMANGEEVAVTNNAFTIPDVQSDYTIFANFAPNYVTVTVNQPAHAAITPGTQTYAYGATPSYMIVPEVGYEVVSVTAGTTTVNVTYNNGIGTFTLAPVTADITLTATTSIKKYEITVTQGANGTIAPGTQTNVEYGSNKTFTITPNQYYVIADVIVDGSSRGALSSYTFYNVTGNHTITAVFEANCQTPTNLTAMDIDTSSAVLNWVGTASSYEVRYKAADAASYTTQTVTTTSLQLTGLTPNTLYEYGVRAVCGANLTSDWATNAFTTRALPLGPVDGIANAELSSIKVYSYLNNVYIVNEEGIAISNVDIYDIYGKQVYTGKVLSSPEVISLSVANGNYVVRLATENGVGVYKVAIVR